MASQTDESKSSTSRFSPLLLRSGYLHPFMLYGTAWKEERTASLTTQSLKIGYPGLDTANYPTAYEEPLTGDGLAEVLKSGVKREEICVQTKFTPAYAHAAGKCPFDTTQDIEQQVRQSIEQSFKNLQIDHIDLFLLHAPFQDDNDNIIAWRVFESYVPDRIGNLGVSNFSLASLKKLYDAASIKPEMVQNRFYSDTDYDMELRAYMAEKGMIYQAFHLFKANQDILTSDLLGRVAATFGIERELAFYMLVLGLGRVSIINGTTNDVHMKDDLQNMNRILGDPERVLQLEGFGGEFEGLLREVVRRKALG